MLGYFQYQAILVVLNSGGKGKMLDELYPVSNDWDITYAMFLFFYSKCKQLFKNWRKRHILTSFLPNNHTFYHKLLMYGISSQNYLPLS